MKPAALVVAGERDMADVAEGAGLQRASRYPALSPRGNARLKTQLVVLHATGLRLGVRR